MPSLKLLAVYHSESTRAPRLQLAFPDNFRVQSLSFWTRWKAGEFGLSLGSDQRLGVFDNLRLRTVLWSRSGHNRP